jgi:cytochrome c oxidase subunit II
MVVLVMRLRTVPLVLVLLISVATVPGRSESARQAPTRVIHVTAERFDFFPSEITLEEGERVEIRITSEDTNHGFRIQGGGVNLVVPKRGKGEAVTVFSADKAGTYTFECSRMCGAGHHFMRGEIVVRAKRTGAGQ